MLLELLVALFLGILAGVCTGLLPGIHINLVSTIILSLSASLFFPFPVIVLSTFIIAMAITHTFLDFIPSIFLGCPDADTVLSVLPGHQLLQKGHGHEAVMLTLLGSFATIIFGILLLPFFLFTIPKIYPYLKPLTGYILLTLSVYIVIKDNKKVSALAVFLLAGWLGYLTLNIEALKEPLLPLLTGLFGASTLIASIYENTKIPKQENISFKEVFREKTEWLSPLFTSLIIVPLFSILPAIGSGQAAALASEIKRTSPKQFLVINGAMNTGAMLVSFWTLYAIKKTRTGAAVALQTLIPSASFSTFIYFSVIIIVVSALAFFIGIKSSYFFSKKINAINYRKISITTFCFLIFLVLIISSFIGFLIFILATITGIYALKSGVRRINLMGCLLLPTILFYLAR